MMCVCVCGGVQIKKKTPVCVTLGPTGGVRGSSGVGGKPHGPHMASTHGNVENKKAMNT